MLARAELGCDESTSNFDYKSPACRFLPASGAANHGLVIRFLAQIAGPSAIRSAHHPLPRSARTGVQSTGHAVGMLRVRDTSVGELFKVRLLVV